MSGGLEILMRNILIGWMHEAAERGCVSITKGVRLYSAWAWAKMATENGKPVVLADPFLVEYEAERWAVECSDVFDVMDCLDEVYRRICGGPTEEDDGKIIPFPTGGTA